MMDLLGDIEYARAYIDDILITSSGSYEDHIKNYQQYWKDCRKQVSELMSGNATLQRIILNT